MTIESMAVSICLGVKSVYPWLALMAQFKNFISKTISVSLTLYLFKKGGNRHFSDQNVNFWTKILLINPHIFIRRAFMRISKK